MSKKTIATKALLLIAIIFVSINFHGCSQQSTPSDLAAYRKNSTLLKGTGLYYNITNNEAMITKCKKKLDAAIIPASIDGHPVTQIIDGAFDGCQNLVTVEIPKTVTNISNCAFSNCQNLESINIDEDNEAYTSTDGILYSKDMTEILFYPSAKTSKSFTTPSTVKTLKAYSFNGCKNLENLTILPKVKYIEDNAFNECTSLKKVVISKSVKFIGAEAFKDCGIETIFGEKRSSAESFAKKNNLKFVEVHDIASSKITVEPIDDKFYNRTYHAPAINIKNGDKKLKLNVDYKILYSDNRAIGTATATITGINDYFGTRTANFKIMPDKLVNIAQSDERFTKSIELTWPRLIGGVRCEIYRASSENGIYKKIATTKKKTYKNKKLTSGKIYYYKFRTYRVVDSKHYYSEFSDVITASTKCKTPTVKLASTQEQIIDVSWNKIPGADGYEVLRASRKNGNFSRIKTVKNGKTTNLMNTDRTSGKTYYYMVRAYKMVADEKVYSSDSIVKSIKAK